MKNGKKLLVTYLVVTGACLFFAVAAARAVTFTVTKTADTNDGVCSDADCSLREAVGAANALTGADTVVFKDSVFAAPQPVQQIYLSLSLKELYVNDDLTINGPGARQLLINGNGDDRIFTIHSDATVSIRDLGMLNGHVKFEGFDVIQAAGGAIVNYGDLTLNRVRVYLNKADFQGGGILNMGSLTILYSVISNNDSGQYGGAIYSQQGTVEIANSTISDNEAQLGGGGIDSRRDSPLFLNNVTVSHNKAGGEGGGILAETIGGVPSNKRMRNTIVANNTAADFQDVGGRFVSQGSNLIRINSAVVSFPAGSPNNFGDYVGTFNAPLDPLLGPLQNNGGPGNTRALLSGSPALDKGDSCVTFPSSCAENKPPIPLVYDQHYTGFGRSVGAAVDIGAFEAEFAPTAAAVSVGGRVRTADGRGIRNVAVTVTFPSGEQRAALSGASGFYRFADVPAGATYVFGVSAKRYAFSQPTQIRTVTDGAQEDVDFIADPPR